MSELLTDEEQIIWFLREFENAEDDQLKFCELEIYGEDEQGREVTCTISVQEIAKMTADFITKMQSALRFDEYEKLFPEEIRDVRAEAGRAGFVAGWQAGCLYADNLVSTPDGEADQYAERVKEGGK